MLILTDNYAIGIENKIFHYLHNDLNDYYQMVMEAERGGGDNVMGYIGDCVGTGTGPEEECDEDEYPEDRKRPMGFNPVKTKC